MTDMLLLLLLLLLLLQVERIIILGLSGKDYTATASVGGQQRQLEATQGPLSPKAAASTAALVIRKPLLPVGEDWAVTLA